MKTILIQQVLVSKNVLNGVQTFKLFIDENFTILSEYNIFQIENLVTNLENEGCIITYFDQIKKFKEMELSRDSLRILLTPNAGGNSIVSEVLSFEMFKKYFNAHLLKTEMEVEYFPEGGSINDYVMKIFNTVIGVSVTRAMKYPFDEAFTIQDATNLLTKKLKGIVQSSKNSMEHWNKQILHVWVMNEYTCNSMLIAWSELSRQLKTNTVLLITVAENSNEIFKNLKKII